MKVQVDALGVRYSSIGSGATFNFANEIYLKTSLVSDNLYYAVNLSTGLCTKFLDDTVVIPIKLMVVPEE